MKNVPDLFDEEDQVVITRKLHGTNARYGIVRKKKLSLLDRVKKFFGNKWVEFEWVYGSHNVEKGSDSQGFYSTDVWRTIGDEYKIKEKLWEYVKEYFIPQHLGSGIVIYGEMPICIKTYSNSSFDLFDGSYVKIGEFTYRCEDNSYNTLCMLHFSTLFTIK
jgi:hypothetical protein